MAKKGNIPWNKGKPWSKKIKKRISKANTGKPQKKGKNSPNWKGNKAKYHQIHLWIRRVWGQLQFCEFCGITKARKLKYQPNNKRQRDGFHWAMKHGTYSRERSDWFRLCISCHKKYDNRGKIS